MKRTIIALMALIILAAFSSTEEKTKPTYPSFPFQAGAVFEDDLIAFAWQQFMEGENYLQYVPNVGHGLHGSYLPENLISFYHSTNPDNRNCDHSGQLSI
jgi:hypothetical protein